MDVSLALLCCGTRVLRLLFHGKNNVISYLALFSNNRSVTFKIAHFPVPLLVLDESCESVLLLSFAAHFPSTVTDWIKDLCHVSELGVEKIEKNKPTQFWWLLLFACFVCLLWSVWWSVNKAKKLACCLWKERILNSEGLWMYLRTTSTVFFILSWNSLFILFVCKWKNPHLKLKGLSFFGNAKVL